MIWSSGVAPSYAGEISAIHIRGTIGSLFSLFIAVGSLFGNILGLSQVISIVIANSVDICTDAIVVLDIRFKLILCSGEKRKHTITQ